MTKKICVITGTRAEYGLLNPLIKKLYSNNFFELQIIATGMHLSPEFGLTYKEIENDGFVINEKIEMLLSSDTDTSISKSIGLGLISFADALERLKPDMVVVLGDRFEIFAAVTAAFVKKIPVAHLHGGETTEGAIDEGFRHSITKMSYLHFVSTEQYKNRVIQLGENPDRVFNTGAIALDNIRELNLLSKEQLSAELNFSFGDKNALLTFHSVTLENKTSADQFKCILDAILKIDNLKVIITKPNSDADGRIIIKMIDDFVIKYPEKASAYTSLGQLKYLSAIKAVDIVIGNSSSGILEVPAMGKPTVNIGDRQKGRIKPEAVIDCECNTDSIIKSINKALLPDFQKMCRSTENPYGDGYTSEKIIEKLILILKSNINLKKQFYDL